METEEESIRQMQRENTSAKRRIAILERELKAKTDVLEKTADILSQSQRQYRELLKEIESLREQKYSTIYEESQEDVQVLHEKISRLEEENRILRRNHQSKYYPACSSYQKTINQLKDVEEEFKDITLTHGGLKSKYDILRSELSEWESLGETIFEVLAPQVHYNGTFPTKSEARRMVLSNMIQRSRPDYTEENEMNDRYTHLKYKYQSAQSQLKEVQRRCDRMLDILHERGISYYDNIEPSHHHQCNKSKISNHRSNQYHSTTTKAHSKISTTKKSTTQKQIEESKKVGGNMNPALNGLGNHVKELHEVTKQMKNDYKEYVKLTKQDDKPEEDL